MNRYIPVGRCLSPFHAELQAILYSLIYFGHCYRNIIVETDCVRLSNMSDLVLAKMKDYEHLQIFLRLTGSSIHYAPRQVNMVAHYLAQHARPVSGTLTFTVPSQLPYTARGFYTQMLQQQHYELWTDHQSALQLARSVYFKVVCIAYMQAT